MNCENSMQVTLQKVFAQVVLQLTTFIGEYSSSVLFLPARTAHANDLVTTHTDGPARTTDTDDIARTI